MKVAVVKKRIKFVNNDERKAHRAMQARLRRKREKGNESEKEKMERRRKAREAKRAIRKKKKEQVQVQVQVQMQVQEQEEEQKQKQKQVQKQLEQEPEQEQMQEPQVQKQLEQEPEHEHVPEQQQEQEKEQIKEPEQGNTVVEVFSRIESMLMYQSRKRREKVERGVGIRYVWEGVSGEYCALVVKMNVSNIMRAKVIDVEGKVMDLDVHGVIKVQVMEGGVVDIDTWRSSIKGKEDRVGAAERKEESTLEKEQGELGKQLDGMKGIIDAKIVATVMGWLHEAGISKSRGMDIQDKAHRSVLFAVCLCVTVI